MREFGELHQTDGNQHLSVQSFFHNFSEWRRLCNLLFIIISSILYVVECIALPSFAFYFEQEW
jgi:hypothetical protein